MADSVDIFLKIEGIEGEANDPDHKGSIEVMSWTWGATQRGTVHQGGGRAGKSSVHDLHAVVRHCKA
jgi:type VI secretion system secreted protein Hcp